MQGVPEVKKHLESERARYGGGLTHTIRVLGANEDTDVVFLMIESKPSSMTDHTRYASHDSQGSWSTLWEDDGRHSFRRWPLLLMVMGLVPVLLVPVL